MLKPEVKSRTQGSMPRPRTAIPRTDPLEAKDRNARGQSQRHRSKCSSSSSKKGLQNKFSGYLKKEVFKNFFHVFSERGNQKTSLQFFREVSGGFQQNFNGSKNSAVIEPRTGQFSRTWGFEAKAKDLTFKAKAKDFKMCPRGLYLWYYVLFTYAVSSLPRRGPHSLWIHNSS